MTLANLFCNYNAESVERAIAFGAGHDEIMPSGALSRSNNNGGSAENGQVPGNRAEDPCRYAFGL